MKLICDRVGIKQVNVLFVSDFLGSEKYLQELVLQMFVSSFQSGADMG